MVIMGFAAPWSMAQSGGTSTTTISVSGSATQGYQVTSTSTVTETSCVFGTYGDSDYITSDIGPYSDNVQMTPSGQNGNIFYGVITSPSLMGLGPGNYGAWAMFPGYEGYDGTNYAGSNGSEADDYDCGAERLFYG